MHKNHKKLLLSQISNPKKSGITLKFLEDNLNFILVQSSKKLQTRLSHFRWSFTFVHNILTFYFTAIVSFIRYFIISIRFKPICKFFTAHSQLLLLTLSWRRPLSYRNQSMEQINGLVSICNGRQHEIVNF